MQGDHIKAEQRQVERQAVFVPVSQACPQRLQQVLHAAVVEAVARGRRSGAHFAVSAAGSVRRAAGRGALVALPGEPTLSGGAARFAFAPQLSPPAPPPTPPPAPALAPKASMPASGCILVSAAGGVGVPPAVMAPASLCAAAVMVLAASNISVAIVWQQCTCRAPKIC